MEKIKSKPAYILPFLLWSDELQVECFVHNSNICLVQKKTRTQLSVKHGDGNFLQISISFAQQSAILSGMCTVVISLRILGLKLEAIPAGIWEHPGQV